MISTIKQLQSRRTVTKIGRQLVLRRENLIHNNDLMVSEY